MKRSRRHHYLPEFLLSAFQVPGGRRVPRVRGLRADGVFEAGVRDVGVETDFHHDNGFFRDPEGMLSEWEGEFANEIKRWTVGPLDEKGRAAVDRLIPHLRLRSRTFRLLGARLMRSCMSVTDRGIVQAVSSTRPTNSLRAQLGHLLDEAIHRAGTGTWNESSRDYLLDEAAKRVITQHISHWSIVETARFARALLTEDMATEMLTGVHTILILTTLMNQRKFEAFGDCQWEIIAIRGGPLLLGDVGPVCAYRGQTCLKPLYAAAAPLQAVFLPLGPQRLVVGWHGERPKLPSAASLNEATLELSHEFVVGTWPAARLKAQAPRLAARAAEDTPERILGIEAESGMPFVAKAAQAIADWSAGRVDRYWGGTETAHASMPLLEVKHESVVHLAPARSQR